MSADPALLLEKLDITTTPVGLYDAPRALIGGLDLSASPPLPADVLAFTVTPPMLERLCRLDEASFLLKLYWTDLPALRARQRRSQA